jgi:hypothetical protein
MLLAGEVLDGGAVTVDVDPALDGLRLSAGTAVPA